VLERELLVKKRELLSEEAEIEVELSDTLWELVEREVETEQPTRTRSTGISTTRAEPEPSNRMCALHRSALRRPVRC